MKKALILIVCAITLFVIICVVSYNPWFANFETCITNDGSCAFAGGKYYYISAGKLYENGNKNSLDDYITEIVPCGDNLLAYDGSTIWRYDTAKYEKIFLWKPYDTLSYTSLAYDKTDNEAFVFCENTEMCYIVRGSTGEVFGGKRGETAEKDGFLYNFNHPCTVTTPQGSTCGFYEPILRKDIDVYAVNSFSSLLIETPYERISVSTPDGYGFSHENIFSEGEKVFILTQYRDTNRKKYDQLFVLNSDTLRLEKIGTEVDGRIVTYKNGTPLTFKNGVFFYEGREISRLPLKTRSVKTVVCGKRIFVYGKDNVMIHQFDF